MLRQDITPSLRIVSYWDDTATGFSATVQPEPDGYRISIHSSIIAPADHMHRFGRILTAAAEMATYLNAGNPFPGTEEAQ